MEEEKKGMSKSQPIMKGSLTQRKKSASGDRRTNDDLINFLEHKLEEFENKLRKTQADYDLLQTDYLELQEKMTMNREKYKRAALLLTEFLDDTLNQSPNILDTDKDMHLNLEKM